MGQIFKKNVLLLNLSQIQLNYAFLLFWSILFTENFSFYSKNDYLRKKLRNTQKDFYSQQVWKVEKPEENLDLV